MPREKDPFRDYVEFRQNNKWKCKFCKKEYRGSVTRIKAHLAGLERYGIHGCKAVDGGVRSEALKAMKGKGAAESNNGSEGNVGEGPHLPVPNEDARRETSMTAMPYPSFFYGASPSTFLPLPVTNLPDQSLPAQIMIPQTDASFWTQLPQSHAGDSDIQLLNLSHPSSGGVLAPEALTNMPRPWNAEEVEPNAEVPQGDARTDDAVGVSRPGNCGLVDENMPTLKSKLEELSNQEANMDELETWRSRAKRIKREYSSMVQAFREGSLSPQQIERVDDLSKEVEEILGHCSFQKGSTAHAARCRKSSPLVTTELVGEESEDTIEDICEYLMDDEIFIIGIHGMGGIGKTAILMHVHNRVLENPAFNNVIWVTVPKEFSIYELQDEIANAIGLDNLSKDKDVKRRACILSRHLKKKRLVLLLDDLWMHFEVEDVGISIEKGGLKLVLTTRSLDVCHKMLCQRQIQVGPLLDQRDDSWSLFFKKLCFGRELPSEVEEIARSIVSKCGGLPLGIIEIATRMRGVEEVYEWKELLRKLEDSMMELDVFKTLKLSYTNLGNPQVQQCFLHLVLCFEEGSSKTTREDLIESFIDEGLLGGTTTRQKLHDQGNIILDKIDKACLGVDIGYWHLYVHPLIKDMALQIVMSTVKACMGLEEIPREEFWTDDLEKVFLQSNNIKEIPNSISPNCPKLTRMSLNGNVMLRVIPESFFRHLKGLKVLDLSNTEITELPDPISHLESLEALLLRGCKELRRIPCVRKLGSLRKLDLKECKMLEEVPEGMEMLVKLMYLNLVGTKIEMLPKGVLRNLVNLQYLAIQEVRAGEETELKKVEVLCCSVPNVETFNTCTRFLEQNSSRQYGLCLNELRDNFWDFDSRYILIESCHSIATRGDGEIGGDGRALLPKNVKVLKVRRCNGVTSLCEVGPLHNQEELEIMEWEKLEELGAVHFPQLQSLTITGCSKLKHLWKEGQGLPCLRSLSIVGLEELEGINIAAPVLKDIVVEKCREMKRVVEWEWLATHLPNLESIDIGNCEKLEEIIGGRLPSGATCRLTSLEISGCNNLKRELMTHDMLLHLPSLREITVRHCRSIEVIIGAVPNSNMTHSSFPKLTDLILQNLPELKSICDGTVSCDSLPQIFITKCPNLKRIPLQLPQLDSRLPSPCIWIEQETWQMLESDHPYHSSLEPFVSFNLYF